MNLKHLHYFWKVAKHGGVLRASEAIHISPQTLSGQIKLLEEQVGTALFRRQGRSLELTEAGKLAFEYAEEMFTLGAELDQVLRQYPQGRAIEFRVGVADALPKSLAYRLLRPAIKLKEPIRIVCREWRIDRLLAELALHRLDMVIADTPVPANIDVKAYSHKLGESGVAFMAHPQLARKSKLAFPDNLEQLPLLLPGEDSAMRKTINEWLDLRRLRVSVVGEFDDAALMAAFGREQVGVFPVPTALVAEYAQEGVLTRIGDADAVRIKYYALTIKRRLSHPCVLAITSQVDKALQAGG
ncbi:MAG: transcriptional activator NhaR [Sterolibacteriaceae bacterium MAG5]|nr:transcriptional activator NhaR [Candidatus Nitricoxidireducens bremensis]